MRRNSRLAIASIVCLAMLAGFVLPADARPPFTTSYLDGQNWNTVFAQGFSPSISPTPNPGTPPGDPVYLTQFQFFKSGNADSASDIRLVILNNIFGDLTGLSTSSSLFVGASDNTIASTAPIATGDPITFTFSALPLTFGNNYAAVYANISGGGAITPVLVSSLTANYSEQPPGSGTFKPTTNYGTESQFVYATSNFITTNQFGSFFNTFSFAGDANFRATLDTPEPGSFAVVLGLVTASGLIRRRRR